MSKYKSPIGGSGKRTTNLFYRSGINSLLSRIEKLENEVFCNNCINAMTALDGTQTANRTTSNHGTILWSGGTADGEVLTLWPAKKGDTLTVILAEDMHGSGGSITVADTSGYFWGFVVVHDNADDKLATQRITQAAASAAPGTYDFLQLEDDANDTGGQAGDVLRFSCPADNEWHVEAHLGTTGTPTSIATIVDAAG
jgi:hypothetical protein